MNEDFNKWWNNDLLTEDNPFVDGTPAYWAWEGWCAAVKSERGSWPAEMEAMERQVNILTDALAQAKADEREVIAQSLDKQADLAPDEIDRQWAQEMAAAVRARGEHT